MPGDTWRARDKARRRTVQYVEHFVRAGRRRFGPAPHSLGEVGWMRSRSRGLVRIAGLYRHLLTQQ